MPSVWKFRYIVIVTLCIALIIVQLIYTGSPDDGHRLSHIKAKATRLFDALKAAVRAPQAAVHVSQASLDNATINRTYGPEVVKNIQVSESVLVHNQDGRRWIDKGRKEARNVAQARSDTTMDRRDGKEERSPSIRRESAARRKSHRAQKVRGDLNRSAPVRGKARRPQKSAADIRFAKRNANYDVETKERTVRKRKNVSKRRKRVHLQSDISASNAVEPRQGRSPMMKRRAHSRRQPNIEMLDVEAPQSWVMVTPTVYVYSAYIDERFGVGHTQIRVIGALQKKPPVKQYSSCIVVDGETEHHIPAKVRTVSDHHGRKFWAAFFVCEFDEGIMAIPKTVRFFANDSTTENSVELSVTRTKPRVIPANETSIAVCVRPFFSNAPTVSTLAQFVAYYTVHGVTSFTFYYLNISPEVKGFIEELSSHYHITLIPWSLPIATQIWARGQNAFTQDCIYRNMYHYRYVAPIDLDEFIFPTSTTNGKPTRLADFTKSFSKSKSCYCFRNLFWLRPQNASKDPLYIFQSTNRGQPYPPFLRTKYLAKPERVVEAGIHSCKKFIKKGERNGVVRNGLLFHYRVKSGGRKRIYDDRMLAWGTDVATSKVMQLYREYISRPPL